MGWFCPVRCPSDTALVVFVGEIDGPASESSFDTDVTVMKFLVVANRVAILDAYKIAVISRTVKTASK